MAEADQIDELVEEVVDKVAPLMAKYVERFQNCVVESNVKTFKAYRDAGMSDHEAVRLMLASKDALNEALKNIKFEQK